MGKVSGEVSSKPAKSPSKAQRGRSRLLPFFLNFVRTGIYKPTQGWHARLWTAIGLGALVVAGLYRLYQTQLADAAPLQAYGIPAALGLVLGWIVWRVVHYPPFADFLIATEAEMNKVSWTSRDDLYRATVVVIVTVLLVSLYLFGVDWLWANLLQLLRVLKFAGDGAFGSQAG